MPMIAMSPEGAELSAVVDMVTASGRFDRVRVMVSDTFIPPPPRRERIT